MGDFALVRAEREPELVQLPSRSCKERPFIVCHLAVSIVLASKIRKIEVSICIRTATPTVAEKDRESREDGWRLGVVFELQFPATSLVVDTANAVCDRLAFIKVIAVTHSGLTLKDYAVRRAVSPASRPQLSQRRVCAQIKQSSSKYCLV